MSGTNATEGQDDSDLDAADSEGGLDPHSVFSFEVYGGEVRDGERRISGAALTEPGLVGDNVPESQGGDAREPMRAFMDRQERSKPMPGSVLKNGVEICERRRARKKINRTI